VSSGGTPSSGGGSGGGSSGSSGGSGGPSAPAASASATVQSGQPTSLTVMAANGTTVTVTLPAGAVPAGTTVQLAAPSTLPTAVSPLSGVLALADLEATGPGGASVPLTTTATVSWTLPTAPAAVQVVGWNPLRQTWQPLPGVDRSGQTVTVSSDQTGVLAIVPSGTVPVVQRIAGSTRIGTAIAAAEAAFPNGAPAVVLAQAGGTLPSPDALAAAGLAGAVHGPVLLTAPDHLSQGVLATIQALGAHTVYVVGGPAAVSDAVVQSLQAAGLTVVRAFEGTDRFDTAALIDAYLTAHHLTAATTVYVANGVTMVDALSASPLLFQQAAPLILVQGTTTDLAPAVWQWLSQSGITRVVLLGGPAAVSTQLAATLRAHLGTNAVVRWAGATRDQTAVAIDAAAFPHATGAVIAANGSAGGTFVDALSAAPLAGRLDLPLVLTNPGALPASTAQYLSGLPALESMWVMGGPAAVTPEVAQTLLQRLPSPSS
jgi:putative cell wall-binding protein